MSDTLAAIGLLIAAAILISLTHGLFGAPSRECIKVADIIPIAGDCR